ncbi:HPr family phosphocarrier protein [Fictibacillus sp. Mic-4]|uniref:HPr family phosphocarrier protein n=1 Tax=Fictibacillus TaxID=1329200 RepID=UPI0003FC6A48|nr:HPr family phosphocarrier protein [Fictibacillus gelatini]
MKTYILVPEKLKSKTILEIVKTANAFKQCQIDIQCNGFVSNAKSLLSVSMLYGKRGLYCIHARGKNGRQALDSLREVFTCNTAFTNNKKKENVCSSN